MSDSKWVKVEMGNDTMWDFETDKEFVGVFLEKREHIGDNDSNVYVFEGEDNKTYGIWGNSILDSRLKNIQVGEEVKIEYLGKKKSEKNPSRMYKDFDVWHRPAPMKKVEEEKRPF